MIVYARLTFGTRGNAQGCLIDGWGAADVQSIQAVDGRCSLRMPYPDNTPALALEIDVSPDMSQLVVHRQRLAAYAGIALLGETILDGPTTLCFDVPPGVQGHTGALVVTLTYSDATGSAAQNEDKRNTHVYVRGMRLIVTETARPILPRSLAPLQIADSTQAALEDAVLMRTGVSVIELLGEFESLGHNCEFGLMQRGLGAEPLGLLRFGGIEPPALLLGLECAFAGIEALEGLHLERGRMNGREEYLTRDRRFGLRTHTGLFIDEVAPDAVDFPRMARYLGFLQRQFADVLRGASRIFVLHHPDICDTTRALPVLNRLRSHGNNTLLYVTENRTVQPGTVVQERSHLCHGYIDHLVPMDDALRINLGAWISLCANTFHLIKSGKALLP